MPEPDSTAVRTALWRAMHVLVDPPPHVMDDVLGLRLAAPDDDWRARGDMDPGWTAPFRAGMVARGRFVEDLVRGVAARLADDGRFDGFVVEAENFESIHNHSAYARIARGM